MEIHIPNDLRSPLSTKDKSCVINAEANDLLALQGWIFISGIVNWPNALCPSYAGRPIDAYKYCL